MTAFYSLLALIVEAVSRALFGAARKGIDDARDDQAHEDVGVLRQREADTEAARQAQDDANVIALEPRDRAKTPKRLRDGEF